MKKRIQQIQVLIVTLLLLTSIFVDCGVKPVTVYGAQTGATSEVTITNKQLDSKLSKTQQWVNSVSDNVEKSGLVFLDAEQTSKGELKLTTLKKLNDNFSSVTTVTFASNNKNAEFQVVILKDSKELAVQKMSGQIEKNSSGVFFKYTDSKTKKENTVNLTSGHSSAVAAIPLAFEMVGGASELVGMTAAMTAALPAIAIVGGAAVVVGGGYYLYTKSTVAKTYPNASVSRANVAQKELASLTASYKANTQANNSAQAAKNLSSIKGYSKALNTNIKSINVNVNSINTNVPSTTRAGNIDLTDFYKTMSDFNQTMTSFNQSMKETTKYLENMNVEISKNMAELSKGMAGFFENMEKLEDYFRFSATPSFSSVTYDKNTKCLNLVGSMPSESTVYIYVDAKLVQVSETDKKGNFNFKVNVKQGEVAVDTIQKPINGKKYMSCSMIGLLGFPTFKIHEDGDLTTSERTNKYLKNPLLVRQTTASPTFDKVTYDSKTKTLNLVGSMPSASTLDIYIGDKKIRTEQTAANGSFNIKVNVENNSVAIRAIQNPTSKIKYVEPFFSNVLSYPKFTVQADGTIFVNSQANKLLKQTLQEGRYTASPTFDKVTYDSKTKTLNLVGSMPSASTLDIYIGDKKIRTEQTMANGSFNIKVNVENNSVAIRAIQNPTSKIKYVEPFFSNVLSYPKFTVQADGTIFVNSQANKLLKQTLQEGRYTASPTFDKVTYDSKTKTLNLVGSMPSASTLDIYIGFQKIRTEETDNNGHFDIKVKVENDNVAIDAVQKSTNKFKYTSLLGFWGAPKFYIQKSGEITCDEGVKLANGVSIKIKKFTPIPMVDEVVYNEKNDSLTVPITMSIASQFTVYRNNTKIQTGNCEANKSSLVTIPLERGYNEIKIDIIGKNTSTTIYSNSTKLEFSIGNSRNIKATSSTNVSLKKKLPETSTTRSTIPKFSDISFDTETNSFNISGKMLWKGTITPYLNGEKLQSISTDEIGRFKLSIPVKRDANGVANIAIDGVNDETKLFKYSSYMDEIDFSTFMIDASGNISVSDFIKNSITPKQVVTPLPNVAPIPVGKGVTVQGKALPNSDVTVKNRGIEYGGKADDKGIFSIPVPEILVNDVVEIFVKAPSTAVISYTTSEAVSVQAQSSSSEATVNKDTPKTNESETTSDINDTIYTPEQMGVRTAQEFAAAVVVENGMLTEESIEQLARLAEINAAANVVTLGSYVANSTSSYDQTAYRAGNTFYTMGSAGWDAIMDKLQELGVDSSEQFNEMWKINQKFLDNQIVKEKTFEFTVNPTTLREDKFGYLEYTYLFNHGYHLVELNERFKMVK